MQHHGVRGTLITNDRGVPIQSDLPSRITEVVSGRVASLVDLTMTLVEGMEEGRLHLLKLETSKGEVLIEPERWWITTSLM